MYYFQARYYSHGLNTIPHDLKLIMNTCDKIEYSLLYQLKYEVQGCDV